ncbi:MAG: hypothetical protein QGH45_19465 [Myxococcota bacterium]|mgnify:CR=1 FL=1|jgi:hypothetical protein|nr:hypothetical protein [Myxococcota bacterium]
MPCLLLLVVIAVLVGLFVVVPRMNELFLVSVRGGEVLVVRGCWRPASTRAWRSGCATPSGCSRWRSCGARP